MNWRRLRLTIPIPFLRERDVHIQLTDGGIVATASVVIAGALALETDIGEGADLSFYATVAQVLPVFVLALVIEVRSHLDRSFDFAVREIDARMDDHEQARALEDRVRALGVDNPELARASVELGRLGSIVEELHDELRGYLPLTRRVVRGYVLAAVPGEAGCLAALGLGRGTTFCFSLGALSLVAMVVLYMRSVSSRYDLDERRART